MRDHGQVLLAGHQFVMAEAHNCPIRDDRICSYCDIHERHGGLRTTGEGDTLSEWIAVPFATDQEVAIWQAIYGPMGWWGTGTHSGCFVVYLLIQISGPVWVPVYEGRDTSKVSPAWKRKAILHAKNAEEERAQFRLLPFPR
jgi:hypothetical protein